MFDLLMLMAHKQSYVTVISAPLNLVLVPRIMALYKFTYLLTYLMLNKRRYSSDIAVFDYRCLQ